jgi:hypothetical protein
VAKVREELQSFDDFLSEIKAVRPKPFKPFAYYNAVGDSMEIYLRPERHISERVDEIFTVFVAVNDRTRIVGLAIKDIRAHFGPEGLGNTIATLVTTSRATVSGLIYGALAGFQFHLVRESAAGKGKPRIETQKIAKPKKSPKKSDRIEKIVNDYGDTVVSISNAAEMKDLQLV